MTLRKMEQEIGFYLGYGRGSYASETPWNASQQTSISFCVDEALRMFYTPTPTDPTQSGYKWSFLYPTATLTLAINANSVDLPDDFGNLEGMISIGNATGGFLPVQLTGEGVIRQQYAATPTTTGRPLMAAVRPLKGTSLNEGQRFDLYIYPAADQAYTLNLRYYVLLDGLTNAKPYPYGGMTHASTILAAARASAEFFLDGMRGPNYQYFMERLMASISQDRGLKPQLVGYNGDRSDINTGYFGPNPNYWNSRVLYNGVQY